MHRVIFSILLVALSASVRAELGITDGCQDEIKDLEEKISDDKDDYTAESRRKAHAELAVARTNRMNAVKCRKNGQDARQHLREGKRDKKSDD